MKILIYYPGHLGDTLAAFPAFRMIKKNYPEAKLILLNHYESTQPLHLDLFRNDDLFAKIHSIGAPRSLSEKIRFYLTFFKICLRHRFHKIFFLSFAGTMPKTLLLAVWILQFKRLTVSRYLPEISIPVHQLHIENLQKCGLALQDGIFDFPLRETELELGRTTAETIRAKSRLPMITFGIGGNQPVCRWGVEKYIRLIQQMQERFEFIPVYAGGESDRAEAEELIRHCGGTFLQNTSCKTLRETIAFFKHCLCYIGNDTGSAHLAAAAGLRCAILYSAHDLPEEKWHPIGTGHLFIRKKMDCAGCGKKVCPLYPSARCMDHIKPEEVLEQLLPWLNL